MKLRNQGNFIVFIFSHTAREKGKTFLIKQLQNDLIPSYRIVYKNWLVLKSRVLVMAYELITRIERSISSHKLMLGGFDRNDLITRRRFLWGVKKLLFWSGNGNHLQKFEALKIILRVIFSWDICFVSRRYATWWLKSFPSVLSKIRTLPIFSYCFQWQTVVKIRSFMTLVSNHPLMSIWIPISDSEVSVMRGKSEEKLQWMHYVERNWWKIFFS